MPANHVYCNACKRHKPKAHFLYRADRTIAICADCRDKHNAVIVKIDTDRVNIANANLAQFLSALPPEVNS